VILGISSRSDFTLTNAEYRALMEIAFSRSPDAGDRRALEEALWSHFLDLTRLDREQAHRIAWLLEGAAETRLEAVAGQEDGREEEASCGTLLMLLREAFGLSPAIEFRPESAEPGLSG
jgi:hypothetical protein